jgi:hypothetical protein
MVADKLTGGEGVNLASGEVGLEGEVKGVQTALIAKVGVLMASGNGTALTHIELILEEEF